MGGGRGEKGGGSVDRKQNVISPALMRISSPGRACVGNGVWKWSLENILMEAL